VATERSSLIPPEFNLVEDFRVPPWAKTRARTDRQAIRCAIELEDAPSMAHPLENSP
jgi:hypothetical protein